MTNQPDAFLSFAKSDDDYEKGRLSQLRDALSAAVRFQSGETFRIFQPHQDVQWGQQSEERVRAALEQVVLFIPVITSGYLNDARCRNELARFLQREQQLGRTDLILPIRYLPTPKLQAPGDDALAQALATREPVDWTGLRRAALDSPQVEQAIEEMATHIIAALERVRAARAATPPPAAPPLAQAAPPPSDSDEQRFESDLLKRHLLRLIEIDRQRVRSPDNINLQMDYDSTRVAINQSAAALGLGAFPDDLAAIVGAVGLRAEYSAFLENQRLEWQRRQQQVRGAEVSASPSDRVNMQMQVRDIAEHLEAIEQQQAALITAPASSGPTSAQRTTLRVMGAATDQTAEQSRSLQRQLDEVEANIRLIEERMAEYVLGTDVPLQLIKEHRRLKEKRDQLLNDINALVGPPAAPTESSTVEAGGRLNALMLPTTEGRLWLARADGVAMVSIGQFVGGQLQARRSTGTAWLIAPDLALTCWHVLEARGPYDNRAKDQDVAVQAANCLLTFNFTEIGSGIDYGVTRIECADRNSNGLDYALLRLTNRSDYPLRDRTPLPLAAAAPLTAISELYIIQHPRGMPQRGAEGQFVQHIRQNTRMHYTINTDAGTSGSPVLVRPKWEVVGLHHGSTQDRRYGEGIALQPILADIRQQRPALYDELMQAQPPRQ